MAAGQARQTNGMEAKEDRNEGQADSVGGQVSKTKFKEVWPDFWSRFILDCSLGLGGGLAK